MLNNNNNQTVYVLCVDGLTTDNMMLFVGSGNMLELNPNDAKKFTSIEEAREYRTDCIVYELREGGE
jgi:hypothetical protein